MTIAPWIVFRRPLLRVYSSRSAELDLPSSSLRESFHRPFLVVNKRRVWGIFPDSGDLPKTSLRHSTVRHC